MKNYGHLTDDDLAKQAVKNPQGVLTIQTPDGRCLILRPGGGFIEVPTIAVTEQGHHAPPLSGEEPEQESPPGL